MRSLLVGTFLTTSLFALFPEPVQTQQGIGTAARDRAIPWILREQPLPPFDPSRDFVVNRPLQVQGVRLSRGQPFDKLRVELRHLRQLYERRDIAYADELVVGENSDRKNEPVAKEGKETRKGNADMAAGPAGGGTNVSKNEDGKIDPAANQVREEKKGNAEAAEPISSGTSVSKNEDRKVEPVANPEPAQARQTQSEPSQARETESDSARAESEPAQAQREPEPAESKQTSDSNSEVLREQGNGADKAADTSTQFGETEAADNREAARDVGENQDSKIEPQPTAVQETKKGNANKTAEPGGAGTKTREAVLPRNRKAGNPTRNASKAAKGSASKAAQTSPSVNQSRRDKPAIACPSGERSVWNLRCPDSRASTLGVSESATTGSLPATHPVIPTPITAMQRAVQGLARAIVGRGSLGNSTNTAAQGLAAGVGSGIGTAAGGAAGAAAGAAGAAAGAAGGGS